MNIYAEFSGPGVLVKSPSQFSDQAVHLSLPEGYKMEMGELGWEVHCGGRKCYLRRELDRSGRWEYFVSSPFIDPSTGEYRPPVRVKVIE